MIGKLKKIERAKDTGLVITLVLLFVLLSKTGYPLILACIGVLVSSMIIPTLFSPLAKIWFGLSHIMGIIFSKVFLTLVFFIIVTPIGTARRLCGADPMMIKKWRQDNQSCFTKRDHVFTKEDMERTF